MGLEKAIEFTRENYGYEYVLPNGKDNEKWLHLISFLKKNKALSLTNGVEAAMSGLPRK